MLASPLPPSLLSLCSLFLLFPLSYLQLHDELLRRAPSVDVGKEKAQQLVLGIHEPRGRRAQDRGDFILREEGRVHLREEHHQRGELGDFRLRELRRDDVENVFQEDVVHDCVERVAFDEKAEFVENLRGRG